MAKTQISAPRVAVEQAAEEGGRVDAWQAEPGEVRVGPDRGDGAKVGEDGVVLERDGPGGVERGAACVEEQFERLGDLLDAGDGVVGLGGAGPDLDAQVLVGEEAEGVLVGDVVAEEQSVSGAGALARGAEGVALIGGGGGELDDHGAELTTSAADTGAALRAARHRAGATHTLFFAADAADEDAFRLLTHQHLGIKAAPGPTEADYTDTSVEQVEHGSTLVADAGATMDQIVTAIRRVSAIVVEISNASAEQSSGVGQIGEAVSQMDQVTQQNAALVEESAAAAESLKQQADQLVGAMAVFRLAAA